MYTIYNKSVTYLKFLFIFSIWSSISAKKKQLPVVNFSLFLLYRDTVLRNTFYGDLSFSTCWFLRQALNQFSLLYFSFNLFDVQTYMNIYLFGRHFYSKRLTIEGQKEIFSTRGYLEVSTKCYLYTVGNKVKDVQQNKCQVNV